jgi:hypothetical protein
MGKCPGPPLVTPTQVQTGKGKRSSLHTARSALSAALYLVRASFLACSCTVQGMYGGTRIWDGEGGMMQAREMSREWCGRGCKRDREAMYTRERNGWGYLNGFRIGVHVVVEALLKCFPSWSLFNDEF